jgi:hypothetical protein
LSQLEELLSSLEENRHVVSVRFNLKPHCDKARPFPGEPFAIVRPAFWFIVYSILKRNEQVLGGKIASLARNDFVKRPWRFQQATAAQLRFTARSNNFAQRLVSIESDGPKRGKDIGRSR